MFNASFPEPDVLNTILEPLLDDFQYWFERSLNLLQAERLAFLAPSQQQDLLQRIQYAQRQVATTRILLQATTGQAIVEMAVVLGWHNLVTECWQVAIQYRASHGNSTDSPKRES